ncbi:hypothetical protein BJ875DRAFT_410247 [Amylocarpus encephaloides]|uniref:Uncharacterized protein n=1 Tax=Amylocarpus encephaloides TaxID=45428 RepID=A0A9P7YAZ6_9HELO|nr:hypothetical protein BJ875DRAFT_410247 [Amylocarpus encephaloides]
MRGFFEAACLLAPALVASIPSSLEVEQFNDVVDVPISDHSFSLISIDIPADSRSHDDDWTNQVLGLRLDILNSKDACGYGNITIDGKVLPQTPKGDTMTGKGPIKTEREAIILANWAFHCVKINGQRDYQLMKLVIESMDGKAMENVGFSALFQQTGSTEILKIETDLSIPDKELANPDPEIFQPMGEPARPHHFDISEEIDELHWMRAQLWELKHLITERERKIAKHAHHHFESDIQDCDTLKCVAKAVSDKARKAAHILYGKISGDNGEQWQHGQGRHHGLKSIFHGRKNGHRKNHVESNSTYHRSHFHESPLPVCLYSPPPSGHEFRHHRSPFVELFDFPSHGPPHHESDDDRPHHPHPPHHDEIPYEEFPHHRPPPHHPQGPPPHPHYPPGPPPPPEQEGPKFPPEFDGPPPPPDSPEHEPEHDSPRPPLDFYRGPPREHHGPPPHHPGFGNGPPHGHGRVIQFVKFSIIVFLVAFLALSIHHLACTSKRRADRKARREERHLQRAYYRAVRHRGVSRLIALMSGRRFDSADEDFEEKENLLSDAEDGTSTTMTDELMQFNNAASVVDDMVHAEMSRSQPSQPIPARTSSLPIIQDYEMSSQIGGGKELPVHEDNDGSDKGSVISDGFRYTPGSVNYTPSSSPSGCVHDILGPDNKQ